MQNYARLGIFGILALIGLRVGIGWHFYMEGVDKVRSNNFSAEGFLVAANGPLKDTFQSMIWDNDGRLRLDQEKVNGLFERATRQAIEHFGLTDDQKREIGRIQGRYYGKDSKGRWRGKLNDAYADANEEIFKYWESIERVKVMSDSSTWTDVTSLRGQKESIENDRMSGVRSTLNSVDAIWKQYEGKLNSVATDTQRDKAGYFAFNRPGEGLLSMSRVNKIVPIFDMVVGILLMIGLLTPLASWAGALFLISVILTQMPGYTGSQPTYYQAIECLGLVVLATMDAGRYAGLDFLPWAWWQKKQAANISAA